CRRSPPSQRARVYSSATTAASRISRRQRVRHALSCLVHRMWRTGDLGRQKKMKCYAKRCRASLVTDIFARNLNVRSASCACRSNELSGRLIEYYERSRQLNSDRVILLTLTRERAKEILSKARQCRILVLGDVMLDEFIWGDVTRISPEAPVPVVNIQRESTLLGGAANVLANVTALGAAASVIGVVGNDAAADKLRDALERTGGVQTDDMLIQDDQRPTTIKLRIIAHSQMVVRADRERRNHVNGHVEKRMIKTARRAIKNADALVISD